MSLAGRKILVVGLGASGRAAGLLCADRGAAVTATDRCDADALGATADELADRGVRLILGGHDPRDFTAAELVVVSPGVPLDLPGLVAARDAGVEVIGELELAARHLDGIPMVAVTGSNGKSTVVAWLGEMLRAAGLKAFVGGNLGRPLSELVLTGERPDWAVVEVSSYQLDTADQFAPQVVGLLNLSPDHLARYTDLEAYYASKLSLLDRLAPGGAALIGPDAATRERASGFTGRRYDVSFDEPVERGVHLAETQAFWRSGAGRPEAYALDRIRLVGRHNVANGLCALALARLCGAEPDGVRAGLAAFPGLDHRMQLVGERGGVRYVNDSKGTNVGAVVAALEGLDATVLLIAGGQDKGTGYAELSAPVGRQVRVLLLIGEAAEAIGAALGSAVPEAVQCGTVDAAVQAAAQRARPGEVVLLSPACASFDQFTDFRARGRAFAAAVEAL